MHWQQLKFFTKCVQILVLKQVSLHRHTYHYSYCLWSTSFLCFHRFRKPWTLVPNLKVVSDSFVQWHCKIHKFENLWTDVFSINQEYWYPWITVCTFTVYCTSFLFEQQKYNKHIFTSPMQSMTEYIFLLWGYKRYIVVKFCSYQDVTCIE